MNTAEDRSQWPSVELVSAPTLTGPQQTAIEVAEGAKRLLDLFIRDIRSRSFLAAEHDRKQAYDLVRQLGPAWLDATESVHGPMSECRVCRHLECDCQCPDEDDIPFAEVLP